MRSYVPISLGVLVYACCPTIIINSILFHPKKCPKLDNKSYDDVG